MYKIRSDHRRNNNMFDGFGIFFSSSNVNSSVIMNYIDIYYLYFVSRIIHYIIIIYNIICLVFYL
jgi:hypothetical protein